MNLNFTIRRLSLLLFAVLAIIFSAEAKFTVVIDAGHGNQDYGAVGKISNEKDINLGVALRVGDLIKKNMPDVEVIYTRNNDTFVTLQGRADIANKAKGDLFISIHTNSVDKKSKNYLTVHGASVYTLGFKKSSENLAVAMRENAVMKLERDYSTTYEGFDPSSSESYIIFEMSQNLHMAQSIEAANEIQKELVSTAGRFDRGVRQANFWVLFKTSMPAILVELDFICNPEMERFMSSSAG
ncbi:MAG: N-acetylmuramoyl-L-alanine amidase, partial [Paramuribaculum sp.]|nr:N-acetylmuramoyl-L-alanine amidase [Paramuribaculum sp.]